MKKLFAFVAVALLSVSMFAENITVAKAVEIGKKLEKGATTKESYTVEGYVAKLYKTYYEDTKTQSFYMCDKKEEVNPDSKDFAFEAFKAKLDKAVTPGAKVTVTGPITNYVSEKGVQTIEIKDGKCVILEEGEPAAEVEKISVAAAIAIAEALAEPTENGKSTYDTKESTVVGYAGTVYANDDGSWSFYMTDEAGAKGDFMASSCKADSDVNKGDFMAVTGKICKYKTKAGKIMYQIYKGTAAHSNDQGIENVELTEKAQKVMVDGVVYIVRDGKLFNLQGAQVR